MLLKTKKFIWPGFFENIWMSKPTKLEPIWITNPQQPRLES